MKNLEAVAGNGLLDRRAFLRGGAALAAAMTGYTLAGPASAEPLADDPWSRAPGTNVPAYGVPSRFEKSVVRTLSNPNGEDHRQLLALFDDAVRFHPARDAVPAAQDAHQRRGLRAYRLSPRAQQADRRERSHERPDAAEGEDAEPGRIHSALSRQAIAARSIQPRRCRCSAALSQQQGGGRHSRACRRRRDWCQRNCAGRW